MISGARSGQMTWLRRLVARAGGQSLTAFVVPGGEIARAFGLDLAAAGLDVVASPRHAAVLVLVGEIPPGLVRATAVVYAQMPRPRAILAVGAAAPSVLPTPDIAVMLTQADLTAGVRVLRTRFATGAWAGDTAPFAVGDADENVGDLHSHLHSGMHMNHHLSHEDPKPPDNPGDHGQHAGHMDPLNDGGDGDDHASQHTMGAGEPLGDMNRVIAESKEHAEPQDTGVTADRTNAGMSPMMHHAESHADAHPNASGSVELGVAPSMEHGDHGMQGMDMGDMNMGGMDMSGGFMSMVAMTKDVPRSPDGLPMEWFAAPFGPLFAGLPGGLALTFTLDGDAVARVQLDMETMTRHLTERWMGPVVSFPDRLAGLDPLAPVAYRLLAWRAIESVAGIRVDDAAARARIGALEYERALSHLNWLAGFAVLLGADGIAREAARLHTELIHAYEDTAIRRMAHDAAAFARRMERVPLLRQRLAGIGALSTAEAGDARGPVARASGHTTDARIDDPYARSLGFASIMDNGGDALTRLRVRVREIAQSLTLWESARAHTLSDPSFPLGLSGMGTATVETPRGAATLHVQIEDGTVRHAHLDTPSTAHAKLVERVTLHAEVADALVGVASLDLSPWEIGQ